MARRGNTSTEASEASTPDTEGTETPESTTTEGTESPVTETKTEPEVDLTAFQSSVSEALAHDGRDTSTGELPVAAIEPVNVQYRALDGVKAKNKAKTWLEDSMKAAMMGADGSAPDFQTARSYMQIKDGLSSAKSGGASEKAPADPKAAFVQRLAALNLAAQIVASSVPEGVDPAVAGAEVTELIGSLGEQVTSYQTWLANEAEDKGDAPEVSPVVKQAIKLSTGKSAGRSGGSTGGPRNDVGKHITEAFAGQETGKFLSVAEIAKFTSEEYGADNHPSQGAVQARLFPSSGKCTVEGIVPQDRTDDTPRGAVKA